VDKKDQRINVTPVSSEDYFMVQTLSELTLSSHSQIVARALNEWLKDNFVIECKRHEKIVKILKAQHPELFEDK
tara:strand:- start:368 stop:589 length:222 start_codon:yes stop_codon:yes gene_type:complete